MQTPPEDKTIIELFQRGGSHAHKAFHILVDQYGDVLYRQIRAIVRNHEMTNDILQNVLLKIYQHLGNFKGESALYTWMYRIARNETLNFLEKEKRRSGVDLDAPVLEILAGHHLLDHLDEERISAWFQEAIDSLPEKQSIVFHLKYFEEMQYNEMSKRLNTSEGALKASFHHARQKIEDFILQRLNHL